MAWNVFHPLASFLIVRGRGEFYYSFENLEGDDSLVASIQLRKGMKAFCQNLCELLRNHPEACSEELFLFFSFLFFFFFVVCCFLGFLWGGAIKGKFTGRGRGDFPGVYPSELQTSLSSSRLFYWGLGGGAAGLRE